QRCRDGDLSADRTSHHRCRAGADRPAVRASAAGHRSLHRAGASSSACDGAGSVMTVLTFIAVLAAVSAALAIVMSGAWLAWKASRNSGWIDTIWTFGLGAVGGAGALA